MTSREPIILGLEGTAHTAGVAVIQGNKVIANESSTYFPPQGGIHPREAANYLAKNFPILVETIFKNIPFKVDKIDGIAFSQGPGLGPCLRTTATVARAISLKLNKPLLGVNHCIAHVELGRTITPADDPLVLYVSGGNTQLITFLNGRYRVLGETLDIAIGNALDTLGREMNLPHPGGPHIEKQAKKGKNLLQLPYTIKGMSFSFSGMVTAAKRLITHHSTSDICYSFQEYTFAILAEATERALSCTKKGAVLLTGGVAANAHLQTIIEKVAEEQESSFYVVPRNLAGDNGVMIAFAGTHLLNTGEILTIQKSQVKPRWRTDQVQVGWIS
ncbi:MAG: bifunctional N(6)-L-threonylcarbamoyladenine synthase/serine/threonine protein kinase [Candidatus Hodarchaeales archaeon]|jgi:N6-L-threonylcarbamoyladenine synthase/protein kinase Bud32